MNVLHYPKRELNRRTSCANNLKQIGLSLKLARVSILVLGIAAFLPLAVRAQSSDGTDRFLLQVAAPNRTVGSDDRPNVLFIIVDDLNVALGSYLDSAPHPHYATAKTPNIDRLAAQSVRFEHAYAQILRLQSVSRFYPEWPQAVLNRHLWQQNVLADQTRRRLALATRALPRSRILYRRVGKIGHNSFEHAISWDVSKFALSREPELRFHVPGYLPGIDLSEVRDNTWTKGSEERDVAGRSLRQGRPASGRPAAYHGARQPNPTHDAGRDDRDAHRPVAGGKQGQAVLHCRRLS